MRSAKRLAGTVCVGLVVLCAALPGLAVADPILERVPADSLFCARLNNLDATMRQVEAFLDGIVPTEELPTGQLPAQIGGLLGDPEGEQVRTDGSFGVFGVLDQNGAMLIGILIPVRSFTQLVSNNPVLAKSQTEGMYKIVGGPEGNIVMMTLTQVGDGYVLATRGDREPALAELAGRLRAGQNTLAGSLDAAAAAEADKTPVWAYANVQRASVIVRPIVEMAFMGIEAELQKASKDPQVAQGPSPAKIIELYRGIVNAALTQVSYVSVGIEPSAKAVRIRPTVVAMPGSDLAALLPASRRGRPIGLLEYLPNGAAINFACRIDDKAAWKRSYAAMFDLLKGMLAGQVDDARWAQMVELTNKSIDAMGEGMVFSMAARRGKPPFAMTQVIDLDDPKAYKAASDKSTELMTEGLLNDFYASMGIKMEFQVQENVATVGGVRIDGMKMVFKTTGAGPDDPAAAAIDAMYGDGLEGYSAIVGDKQVVAMGAGSRRVIERLIGRVRATRPRRVGSEIQQALAMIGGAEKNEAIMTVNVVRLVRMGMAFARQIVPEDVPQITTETRSNVVIGARSSKAGQVELEIVVPKAHVLEIKNAFESLEPDVGEAADQAEPI